MPTENLKVLHVIARLNVGGTARYLGNLLPQFEGESVEALLGVGHVYGSEVEDSILESLNFERINSLGRKISPLQDFRAYIQLRRIVKKYKPDIIHSHTFKAGLLSRLMYPKLPKIHTFHGHLLTDPEFSKFKLIFIIKIERYLARKCSQLITTGEKVIEDLLKVKIGQLDQYISIPGELVERDYVTRELARHELGIANKFTVLWLARVEAVKQPQLLIEVANLCPKVHFLLCGDGSQLNMIRNIAPKNVQITGFIEPEKVILAADVFLSTSANEGIPYSIMEAQQASLPVVAVNSGAIRELITDGEDGFLVDNSVDSIKRKLDELQIDIHLRKKIAANLQAKNSQNSKTEKSVKKHAEIYRKVSHSS